MDPTPSVPDLLLRIMQQNDTGFSEIRQSLAKQNETINRIDRDVALLQRDTEQMKAIPNRVQALETSRDIHARQLADADRCRLDHDGRIGELESTSDHRKGWEGFGGKMLYLLGGAVASAIVTAAALALRT